MAFMKRSSFTMFLFAAIGLSQSGCGGTTGACTLIGCNDALRVEFTPTVSLPYQAAVRFPSGEAIALQCDSSGGTALGLGDAISGVSCSSGGFRLECTRSGGPCTATSVVVELVLADGTRRGGQLPAHLSTYRPNGPGCEPACSLAVVRVL
jgi:hypothetical protein